MTSIRILRAFLAALSLVLPSQQLYADQSLAAPGPDIAVGEVYDYLGQAGGGTYKGEMRVTGKTDDGEFEGVIDIDVSTGSRSYRVRQDFRLAQNGGHVEIRCFHPREIKGHYFGYSSDHFVLVRTAPGVYSGGGDDRAGQKGTTNFTLRVPQ